MIYITAQMRVLVAIESVDGRHAQQSEWLGMSIGRLGWIDTILRSKLG
jgi:hypothetical protein